MNCLFILGIECGECGENWMNKLEFLFLILLCFVWIKVYLLCEVCIISFVDILVNVNVILDVLSWGFVISFSKFW